MAALGALLLPSAADARVSASASGALSRALGRQMAAAGGGSSAYVVDATTGQVLFSWRAGSRRTLASNTKIFTTTTLLGQFGPASSLATTALTGGSLSANGMLSGNLYLRGGGDPTFGGRSFAASAYGSNADVEALAARLHADGVRRVTGSVIGDESLWDRLRGGPDSGFGVSIYVGPLSALSYNRGLANSAGTAFQRNPPLFAATRFTAALRAAGIRIGGSTRTGSTPTGAVELDEVRSPTLARLVQITIKNSDNYFAEMLSKGLPVDGLSGGPLRRAGVAFPPRPVPGSPLPGSRFASLPAVGTTAGGARAAMRYASRTFHVRPSLVDGSGLSHSDRASPRDIADVLLRVRGRSYFRAFFDALSIAGRDGTLAERMRSGPAHDNCRGKTGTLTGVSALSGYCRARDGHTLTFSILMNGIGDINQAHAEQDAMAEAIASY